MKGLSAIVLAAGLGTRMKSSMPKVLHRVAGRPMLFYPLDALKGLKAEKVVVVVGHGADEVRSAFAGFDASFVVQSTQKGTGHAVMCAMRELKGFDGDVLILSGDAPLVTAPTIKGLVRLHGMGKDRPVMTIVSAAVHDPSGYGRVLRDADNAVKGIVEHRDATPGQRRIREINAGIYLAGAGFLSGNLKKLGSANRQAEYYLPDLVGVAIKAGKKVSALTHMDPDEVMGINNRVELAMAERIMRRRINNGLMLSGVTFIDPETAYIDYGVKVGQDTVIHPNVILAGDTVIGRDSVIGQGVGIRDSVIGDGSRIKAFSIIESSRIGRDADIGPFARLRPESVVGDEARVGNFVEMKKTRMGKGSKANHLSYLGDAVIGDHANIGAGTITCNYDGLRKHRTVIEDGAFIGSDTQLVAPVRIGRDAYIGSGSTITRDVPEGALSLSRAEQRILKGWVEKKGLKKGNKG